MKKVTKLVPAAKPPHATLAQKNRREVLKLIGDGITPNDLLNAFGQQSQFREAQLIGALGHLWKLGSIKHEGTRDPGCSGCHAHPTAAYLAARRTAASAAASGQ
jgi:hypothetical protein